MKPIHEGCTPALNSLLIAADQIVRQRKGKPPIKHRKLWINRQRPLDRQLKQVAERLSRGESLSGLRSLPARWDALLLWPALVGVGIRRKYGKRS
jgi:hypothetical protein